MSVVLEVALCEANRFINVSFASDQVAADYIARNSHRFAFYIEDLDNLPLDWEKTYNALFPQCSHGLSMRLCVGPNHYPADNAW
jgi:hypothetical protein